MIPTLSGAVPQTATATLARLLPSPFLHVDPRKVYNPQTDLTLAEGQPGYVELRALVAGTQSLAELPAETTSALLAAGWLVSAGDDPAARFHLKYVSLEAHTVCNQACYFCPVSVAPREAYFMPMELYRRIVGELTAWRSSIEAVFMINYNEPTADRRFVEQVATIREAGLPPAVLTNATGLTPQRVDQLIALGGLRFLSINLSTLDRQRYRDTRGGDQLELVLRHLEYAQHRQVAERMDIVVLGTGDAEHEADYLAIAERFAGSRFTVSRHRVMDRAGLMQIGARPPAPLTRLRGCENVGSRPLQHLHITPHGRCVLCCEDYDERYVIGELTGSTVAEVLAGPEVRLLRRWVYGLEEAPADFMCRKCIFARSR